MPDHVLAAQEFLDAYRLGTFNRKQHACPVNCGYYTDEADKLQTHVQASHPLFRQPQGEVPPIAFLPPQPPLAPAAEAVESESEPESPDAEGAPRRGPGRPRKVPYTVP
jgi:hypothetical protein